MEMTNLFENKYQPGQIRIQTVGSAGPGNSWVSEIVTKQIKGKVEVWYNPDLTEEDESEPYILGSIDYALELREFVTCLSTEKPEGFYFDEITIQGVEGFWKDLIVLSLSEDYSELLEQILSLNDDDLKVFFQNEGPYTKNGILEIDKLNRLTDILFERIEDSGKSNLTLSQLLNHSDLNEKLSLDVLEDQIRTWVDEEEEYQDKLRSEKEARDNKIKLKFKDDIEFAVANYQKYSDLKENVDDVLRNYLENFVTLYKKLPSKNIYYFSFGRIFHDSNFIRNRISRNNPTILASGYIDFKTLFKNK